MASTTEIGDELRDHVIDLLEARGVPIQREVRVNTKKVDVLARIESDFEERVVAIECKNEANNLSQTALTHIVASYMSLVSTREIDSLWVVVSRDFSPEAKNWAAQQSNLQIFSLADFEERQFGFKRYVRQVMELFQEQGLNQYYIPQRIDETRSLLGSIEEWLDSDSGAPVAILGGYGMGKTSFCKFLIHTLGTSYLADQTKRIPLYVRLSEIAKEQELEGLLGKMLASRFRLNHYNFQDIMALNQRGKFVFIFDGFDEMKHALTWDHFRYNFSQINRTVEGRAKVIVAGRPNAFLSDDEHSWALRGTRIAGEMLIKVPGWPEYREVTVQPFSKPEAEAFLQQYLERHTTESGHTLDGPNLDWIASRIEEFNSLSRHEDFSRPVHLKIFADIATNRSLKLKELSVYELYDLSIQETINREMEKPERLPISGDDRRKFLEDVGWWLWDKENGRALNFNPYEVPTTIIRRVLSLDRQTSEEGRLRELFSGAFIERKFGDNFYFAHRSFLEFFVAKKLEKVSKDRLPLAAINTMVNDEILNFIRSGPNFGAFVEYVVAQMARYVGELKLALLTEIDRWLTQKNYDRRKLLAQQHVELAFKALPIYLADNERKSLTVFLDMFTHDLQGSMQERSHNAFFFLVDSILYNLQNKTFNEAVAKVVDFLVSRTDFAHLRRAKASGAIARNVVSRANFFEFQLITNSVATANLRDASILVDFGRIYNDIRESGRPKITILNRSEPVEPGRFVFQTPVNLIQMSHQDRETLLEVLRESGET